MRNNVAHDNGFQAPTPEDSSRGNGRLTAMEFTGERYVPNYTEGPQLSYEHWHRYLYAAQFVTGKTVLDIASGEGYGSSWLAQTAKHVVGIDLDPHAVRHASSKYTRPNLEFRCGSAEVIPVEGGQVFDVVVSFETIEHLWAEQQFTFLHEVDRLLKPDGVLLVSTPNKFVYTDQSGQSNPFHRAEFYYQEFVNFLKRSFGNVHLLGQKVYPMSYLWPLSGTPGPVTEHQLTLAGGRFGPVTGDRKELLYMLAVCSRAEVEVPCGSILLDISEQAFLAAQEVETPQNQEETPSEQKEYDSTVRAIAELRQALEDHVRNDGGQRQVQELTAECDAARRQAQELTAEKEAAQQLIQTLTAECEAARRQAQQLARDNDAGRNEMRDLREAVAAEKGKVSELEARIELMAGRESELREMFLDAHDQLMRRDEEIQAALATALQQHAPDAAAPRNGPVISGAIGSNKAPVPGNYLPYQLIIHRLREAVEKTVPLVARVLVISKGDEALLKLGVRVGWHFPQDERGVYAGHNPADSAAAVEHLEQLRARGADFLLIPATALWWLEHYADFRRHLEEHYREVYRQDDTGVIFALRDQAAPEQQPYQQLIHALREVVGSSVPPEAVVLVISKGDEELLKMEERTGWHFPQDERGVYAGHNPADSAAAVEHLEQLRARGADFLLIPATALWWLEHYADFKKHLEAHYQLLRSDANCVLYQLSPRPGPGLVRRLLGRLSLGGSAAR
jgi:SAM-dependent methyltransferase